MAQKDRTVWKIAWNSTSKSFISFKHEILSWRGDHFFQGEEANQLFILIQGVVHLTAKTKEHIDLLASKIEKGGALFGTGALMEPFRYNLSAHCIKPSEVLIIDANWLRRRMKEDPTLGMEIMNKLPSIYFNRLNALRAGIFDFINRFKQKPLWGEVLNRFRIRIPDPSGFEENIGCENACPVNTRIPQYISAISEGDSGRAFQINREDNLFPAFFGRICLLPDRKKCRKWVFLDSPVPSRLRERNLIQFSQGRIKLCWTRSCL